MKKKKENKSIKFKKQKILGKDVEEASFGSITEALSFIEKKLKN